MSQNGKADRNGTRERDSALLPAPRAYFGRASRAAAASRRSISEAAPARVEAVAKPLRFAMGDPAIRVMPEFTMPLADETVLAGAVITLSGVRDGEAERLLIDLGTSLVRSSVRRNPRDGVLKLVLRRSQSAATYRAIVATLRYGNNSPNPTPGERRIAVQTVNAAGRLGDAAIRIVTVGAPGAAPIAGPYEARGETPPAAEPPAQAARRATAVGEALRFNVDAGGYTLYWWPRLFPSIAERLRREAAKAGGSGVDAAGLTGSYFSAGGRLYRLFDERPATLALAGTTVANESRAGAGPLFAPAPQIAEHERDAAREAVAAAVLRLEDLFGSEMADAFVRRLIERRAAAAG